MIIREADIALDSSEEDGGGEEPWNGIQDKHDPTVDHEDEYMNEDRFTTVTVEAVEVSKDGLQIATQDEGNESGRSGTKVSDEEPRKTADSCRESGSERSKRRWTKEAPTVPKKRKKKFRYENKAERKATRYKEKLGNTARARARKE